MKLIGQSPSLSLFRRILNSRRLSARGCDLSEMSHLENGEAAKLHDGSIFRQVSTTEIARSLLGLHAWSQGL